MDKACLYLRYLYLKKYDDFETRDGLRRGTNVWARKITTNQKHCIRHFKCKSAAYHYISSAIDKKKHGFVRNRIGEVCKAKGIKIGVLGEMLKMKNPKSIYVIASNNAQPGRGLLTEISELLKVPIDDLIIK